MTLRPPPFSTAASFCSGATTRRPRGGPSAILLSPFASNSTSAPAAGRKSRRCRPPGFPLWHYRGGERSWSDSRLTLPWRAAGPGAALFGGGILLCGGNNGKAIQRRAALYDPIDERWTELAVMPEARAVMAALSIGETLYIVGGRDATGKAPVNTVFAFEEGKIRSNDTAL